MGDYKSDEKFVTQYVEQGKQEKALSLLSEMISTAVAAKDFPSAEAFRDRIYEIDSMALTTIVRVNELIDSAKVDEIDDAHKDIWEKLYSGLTDEETYALYNSLEKKSYDSEQIISKQGSTSQYLFFVDKGELKLTCQVKDKHLFLKNIKAGYIAGEDVFFSTSVCTTTLASATATDLHSLHKDKLKKWKTEFPQLENKLKNFCFSPDQHTDFHKKKSINRREDERSKIEGAVDFKILKSSGEPIEKSYRGDLSDISKTGISFFIKSQNRESINMLLGRKLSLSFRMKTDKTHKQIVTEVKVLAVTFHPLVSPSANDYSIHLTCDHDITEDVSSAAS